MKLFKAAVVSLLLVSAPAMAQTVTPAPSAVANNAVKAMATPATEKLDINSATVDQLGALTGVGKTYAQKIVDGRPYARKTELLTKKILPQNVYDGIKDKIIAHHAKK